MTVKQLSKELGCEYLEASSLIKLLVNQGVVKEVGKLPATGGRGKPSSIFEIPNEVELVFWEDNQTETIDESSDAVTGAGDK